MIQRFQVIHKQSDIGFYLGLITSSFLASQTLTNPLWGKYSDFIGRKPIILIGTIGTLIGFLLFGISETIEMVLLF
jgi:MFS family permease